MSIRNAAAWLLAATVLMILAARPAHAQQRDPDLVPHPSAQANALQAQTSPESDVAQALGVDAENVLSVNFGSSDPAGHGILSGSAAGFPRDGGNYLALSSGFTSVSLAPDTADNTSGRLEGAVTPGGGNDMTQMEIELKIPDGVSSLSFKSKFFSEEFPEYVGSAFNDGFVVEVGTSTFSVNGSTVDAPGNKVFDKKGNLITVNTAFGVSAESAEGTTYDGATPTLITTTTLSNISSSSITLIFSVFDVGDDVLDSTVFLDDLQFGTGADLELLGLEVNQSVQSWENSVPLVEDKKTLVRAHLQTQSGSSDSNVDVKLRGTRNGSPLPGSPLPARNLESYEAPSRTSDPAVIATRRADLNESLNFNLPSDWLNGDVGLQLMRQGNATLECSAAVSTDDDCNVQSVGENGSTDPLLTFEPVPAPTIKIVRVEWIDENGGIHQPATIPDVRSNVEDMYPVADLDFIAGRNLVIEDGFFSSTPPTDAEVTERLYDMWEEDISTGIANPQDTYYGFAEGVVQEDDEDSEAGGRAHNIPGKAAFSNVRNLSDFSLSNPFNTLYFAHEVGHVFGRQHARKEGNSGYCGAPVGSGVDQFPYTLSEFPYDEYADYDEIAGIGPTEPIDELTSVGNGSTYEKLNEEMWGYRKSYEETPLLSPALSPRASVEIMSYCYDNALISYLNSLEAGATPALELYNWISDITYKGIKEGITERFASASSPSLAAASPGPSATKAESNESEYLLVRGRIDLAENDVMFRPSSSVTVSPEVVDALTPDPGDFTLEALDETGNVLSEISFEPRRGVSKNPSSLASFSVPVPASSELGSVQVRFEEAVIGSLAASQNAPTVTVESPNGGEFLSGDEVELAWSGDDADRDDLTYTIQYSRNGGSTWKTLNVNWPNTTLSVDPSTLGETENGLIRVKASDGFNTASDMSDAPFTTPNTAPAGRIQSPAGGTAYSRSAPVPLMGKASDLEEDQLTGSSLQWSSDLDGTLGTGEAVDVPGSTLSEGVHNITLTATDDGGLSSVSTVGIEVVAEDSSTTTVVPPDCGELDLADISLSITDFEADPPGSPDTGEFVELTNTGSDDLSLSGCALVFSEGGDGAYYAASLGGIVESGATFLIANPGVEGVMRSFPDDLLQNQPGAVALYKGEAADFPDGTPVTSENRLSVVFYRGDGDVSYDVSRSYDDGANETSNYRLVGLPGTEGVSLGSVLSGSPGTGWTAYRQSESGDELVSRREAAEEFVLSSGNGFWVLATSDFSRSAEATAPALREDGTYSLEVHDGWNIISNPFGQALDWSAVQSASGAGQPLWSFGSSGYEQAASLAPAGANAEAFYFFNQEGLSELVLPVAGGGAAETAAAQSVADTSSEDATPSQWSLALVAARAASADSSEAKERFTATVRAGVAPEAEAGLDAGDAVAPPGRFEPISLRLLLEEKDRRREGSEGENRQELELATEYRSSSAENGQDGQRFRLVLRGASGEEVVLRPDADDSALPSGWKAALIRQSTGETFDLSAKGNPIRLTPNAEEDHFLLVIGRPAFVEEAEQAAAPAKSQLTESYPNPFRDRATIAYDVASESKVQLFVYDVLGRKVRTLVNERQRAGHKEASLRARGLSSGVYVIRLRIGDHIETERLVLVR
jgi:hypothetical protein